MSDKPKIEAPEAGPRAKALRALETETKPTTPYDQNPTGVVEFGTGRSFTRQELDTLRAIEQGALASEIQAFFGLNDLDEPQTTTEQWIITVDGAPVAEHFITNDTSSRLANQLEHHLEADGRFYDRAEKWIAGGRNEDQARRLVSEQAREALPVAWRETTEFLEQSQKALRDLAERHRQETRGFIEEQVSELAKKKQPTELEIDDLTRRLVERDLKATTDGSVGGSADSLRPAASSNPALKKALAEYDAWHAALPREASRQNRVTWRMFLAFHWPSVFEAWREEQDQREREWQREHDSANSDVYRYPLAATDINRVVSGKRHGEAHGLKVRGREESGVVRISVTTPRGAQIELGSQGRLVAKPADRDEQGKLKPGAIMRMIGAVTGPQVGAMGHVAFALAARHAADEGRAADGRFWFSPSEVADLLGYKRESNGSASKSRVGKEAVKTIRRNFATYAAHEIDQTMELPDGTTHRIRGPLLYPTLKEHTERKPGQKGRDKRSEWRIRDELWALIRSRYVQIPIELLDCCDERPTDWANVIRLYEVLAGQSRNDAKAAVVGHWSVSLEWLTKEANLAGAGVRADVGLKRLRANLEKLAKRGALTFEFASLADGREGIRYALPEARRTELADVAGKAAQHKALKATNAARQRRRSASRP